MAVWSLEVRSVSIAAGVRSREHAVEYAFVLSVQRGTSTRSWGKRNDPR